MGLTTGAVRVLVLHDAGVERSELCRLADAAGFRAEQAGSLAELSRWLEGLPAGEARCVLMRAQPPARDVQFALAACEAAAGRAPVVLVRGGEDTETLLAAWAAGAAGLLPRAPTSDAVQAAVYRATQRFVLLRAAPDESCAGGTRPLRVMQATCHDLRNPLSALMINANILLREETLGDERRVKIANRILACADRMNRMLEDLADYASAAQGKSIPVRPTDTDLGTIASEALREVRAAHPGRALVLEQHGDLHGHWDPGRLRQVMHSLLGSALKRGRPGAIVVVDCAEILTPPEVEIGLDYRVELDGQDSPGPPVEREESPPPDGEEASLFVAARIADAHHGSLTVSVADAVGPRFVMRLPKRALISTGARA